MEVTKFISKLNDIADSKTIYMSGTFGQIVTNNLISQCAKRLSWYKGKESSLKQFVDKNYLGFDCVGLIKSILWNFPDISYQSNGVPDIDETTMFNRCSNISSDFSNICSGEAVWIKGHIGVYVGNGIVIECTPKWNNGVQRTYLSNNGYKLGNSRKWDKHGKLPYIDYSKNIEYRTHVQDIGWQEWVSNNTISGTVGQSKRIEAIQIAYPTIRYKTHIQDIGWTDYKYSNEISGTTGQSLRLEAIVIDADTPLQYRVHIQDIGWQNWKTNGEVAGTQGQSKRIEAIQIKLA